MDSSQQRITRQSNAQKSSVHPLHPAHSRVLLRASAENLTLFDRAFVVASSLVIVGSIVWVPVCISWAWKRWKKVKDRKRKALYAALAIAASGLIAVGPHRNPKLGKFIGIRKWRLWESWMKFIAMEVIADIPKESAVDIQHDRAILAFVPHGIFPFAFAFGVMPAAAQSAFGVFRPVVAAATFMYPLVRTILSWCEAVDASRSSVSRALDRGRIGIVPGGIAEIFEGYPKPNTHPDEEYSIVRKGFLRMAMRHNVPVIPVYVFGATKMLKRLDLPLLETLSRWLRVSLVLFFGVWGLPVPFRQRLSYIIGQPIVPPASSSGAVDEKQVQAMQDEFCRELERLFESHKEAYGWGHKTLKLLKG